MNRHPGIHMSEEAAKKLLSKSDRKMVTEQYPEAADQLLKLMDRCDKLEKRLKKAEKRIIIYEKMYIGHIEQHVKSGYPV